MSRAAKYNALSAEIERCEKELLRGKAFLGMEYVDPEDFVSRRGSVESTGWENFPEPDMFAEGEQTERLRQSGIDVYDVDDDDNEDDDDEDGDEDLVQYSNNNPAELPDRIEWTDELLNDIAGDDIGHSPRNSDEFFQPPSRRGRWTNQELAIIHGDNPYNGI